MLDNMEKLIDFREGENAHQTASLYKIPQSLDFEVLNGSELTYKNILDLNLSINVLSEFFDVNASVIVKSGLLAGVALGKNLKESLEKATDCNPIASVNSVLSFSKIVDVDTAKEIHLSQFEVVMAIGFDKEALEILKKNENLKIIKINTPLDEVKIIVKEEIQVTPFGILVQDSNKADFNKDTFKVQTKKKPAQEEVEDAIFAWKVAKHAKSNAAVIVKNFKTLAIAQGQNCLVDACEIAMNYACDETKDAVLALDTTVATLDGIHVAKQGRISLIIQAGGSINDTEIKKQCDSYEMAMITTGMTHFKN